MRLHLVDGLGQTEAARKTGTDVRLVFKAVARAKAGLALAQIVAGKAEQVIALKQLELEYQNTEKERGFKYAELSFQDRDSARKANVAGGTQRPLFWLSLLLLCVTIGSEAIVLFHGYPPATSDLVVGRVLGLMDAVAMLVLSYWYGTTNGSAQKSELLAQKAQT